MLLAFVLERLHEFACESTASKDEVSEWKTNECTWEEGGIGRSSGPHRAIDKLRQGSSDGCLAQFLPQDHNFFHFTCSCN